VLQNAIVQAGRSGAFQSKAQPQQSSFNIAQLTAMLSSNAHLCIIHGVIRGICNSLKVDHPDLLGLPNPVGPCNGLLLILGVGVGVIHHDCVCSLQVEPPACCPDAQQEDEDLAVGGIEALDGGLPTT